ncbi:unnamed protein product [Caenorhabditis bovis]|uniref:C-type lectin domain-containing protein n=1 Tax=Caenorhabditis bovis TaxID=2654633 RepID=A0A8S1F704_9PELO|nr:unnamed protein product [Caenorhabditis bovis]
MKLQFFFFLLLGLATLRTADGQACNYGDTEFAQNCYHYIPNLMTYNDAVKTCKQIGQAIVHIKNSSEAYFLTSTAMQKFGATYSAYWLGLRRTSGNGAFRWEDRSPVSYTNWATGYPFESYPNVAVQISNTKWTSVFDYQKFPVVCQYTGHYAPATTQPPTTKRTVNAYCNGAQLILDNRCYFFFNTFISNYEAKLACERRGLTLAVITSKSTANFVSSTAVQKFGNTYDGFWIGLHRKGSSTTFHWEDGTPVVFTNFADGYPYENEEDVIQQLSNAQWMTSLSDRAHPYVCSASLY